MDNLLYKNIVMSSSVPFTLQSIIKNAEGETVDYVFLEANAAFKAMVGLSEEQFIGKSVSAALPDSDLSEPSRIAVYGEAVQQNNPVETYYFSPILDKSYRVELSPIHDGQFATFFVETPLEVKALSQDDDERQSRKDGQFLSSLSLRLAELEVGKEILPEFLPDIKEYTNAAFATFSELDHKKGALIIKRIEADAAFIKLVTMVAGEKILSTESPVDEETYQIILEEKVGVRDTLTETTFGSIPPLMDKAIRGLTGLRRFVGVAHIIDGKLYGTTVLAFKRNQAIPSKSLLNSYAYLIALALRRNIAEANIKSSEERFRNLADFLPLSICETDTNGKVTFANQAALNVFGYSQEDVLAGVYVSDIIEDLQFDLKELVHNYSLISSNLRGVRSREVVAIRKDLSKFPALIFSNLLFRGGEPIGIRAALIDITEQKKAEREIKGLNESLERKVEERTADLNTALKSLGRANAELVRLNAEIANEARALTLANEQLEISRHQLLEANQSKDKFFSIIAHDLRNPIGGLRNLLETITLYHSRIAPDEMLNLINSAYGTSVKAYDLLSNLLEWALLQRDSIRFNPEVCSLQPIVEEVLELLQPNIESKEIAIVSNISFTDKVYADREQLNTMLRNLLSNAIKYSQMGDKVSITADIANPEFNGYCVVAIQDEGIGIEQKKLANLFQIDKMTSVDGTSGEKGTGLGLILCKEFIEKHNGKIWAESEFGKGSTFYFTIPIVIEQLAG